MRIASNVTEASGARGPPRRKTWRRGPGLASSKYEACDRLGLVGGLAMASRGGRTRRAPASTRRRSRARVGPVASDLVIVSRTLADLADFLQGRQEAAGRGRVILDRREGDRRVASTTVERDRRRQSDRRLAAPVGAEALMRVLGFTVVPSAAPPGATAPRPAAKRARRAARPAARPRRAVPARHSRRRP
jgi:hypothetical protein